MSNILIVYSSTDGHTLKICNTITTTLSNALQHNISLKTPKEVDIQSLNSYDAILVAANIRYGKHSQNILDFIQAHQILLESKKNAFISVNLVARKPEKRIAATNPYVQKFLASSPWKPQQIEIFAGELNYPKYKFLDRLMIQFIMWMGKGPTNPQAIIDYTDWSQVESFAQEFGQSLLLKNKPS